MSAPTLNGSPRRAWLIIAAICCASAVAGMWLADVESRPRVSSPTEILPAEAPEGSAPINGANRP